jgi:hypothetical protein
MTRDKLQSTEVDGVPVFWVPGQRTLRASLWFRAGMADESLPTRGWLHLLEHMALHGRDSIRAPVNGQVSLLHSSFDVEGEPDDVVAFLRDVCRWLATPDFSELEHERRVLRAESATRGTGTVGSHLLWRYGARGPGVAGYDELGLHTAGADRLRQLAAGAYARGNAVLALTGAPPAGLELPLRSGPHQPAVPAVPCDQPAPAGFAGRPGTVALSGTLPRSTAAAALLRALQRALQRDLRHGSGVGYSAWSSYEIVDADHAMLTAGMDVLPEALPTVVSGTTAVLRRLRDLGPDPAELRDDVEREMRRLATEPAEHWLPFLAARDVLLGRPVPGRDKLAAELESLTISDIQHAARAMWNDLLLSADPDSAGDPQLSWLEGPPTSGIVAAGRRFRPAGSPVTKGVLTIGRSAAHIEATSRQTTAVYGDLAALIAYPDGGRRLVRRDGYQVVIEPELWHQGHEAVALVDSAVPQPLHVVLPERTPDMIPRNSVTARQRLNYWLKHPAALVVLALICGIALLATTVVDITDQLARFIVIAVVVGAISYARQRRHGQ